MPGRRLRAISAVASMAPPAMPPQRALERVMMSGVTPDGLVGEPVPGAAEAALHFVEDQQQAVLVGQLAEAGQEAVGRNPHAAFALDRLDHDGGRLVVDQPRDGVEIAERGVDEAGHQRAEALVVLGLGRGGERAERAAVEAALEGDDLVAATGRPITRAACRPAAVQRRA